MAAATRPAAENGLPWWTRAQALRAVIALAAVPGALGILGLVWLLRGAAEADSLARVFQAVMLAVAGFYFGGLGAERAEQQARSASQEAAALRTSSAVTAEATDEIEHRLGQVLEVLDRLGEDPAVRRKINELLREVE